MKLHLSGEDINSDGEQIIIDDRHEGTEDFLKFIQICVSYLYLGTDFFRKRLKQLLMIMFQLDRKHLAVHYFIHFTEN